MIIFDPSAFLKKVAPKRKIEKLLSDSVSLKKSALSFVSAADFLSKKAISRVAAKTIKGYQERIKLDPKAEKEILSDPKQLIQRVQNEVILQIGSEIRDTYYGEKYEWLPSDAEEPDPEHQLNYGKVFLVGDGEMPGERIGCRCGMNILVKESTLAIE